MKIKPLILASFFTAASYANAATVSSNFLLSADDLDDIGYLNYFDSKLGTLTGVNLELYSSQGLSLYWENLGGQNQKVKYSIQLLSYFTSSIAALNDILAFDDQALIDVSSASQQATVLPYEEKMLGSLQLQGSYSLSPTQIMDSFIAPSSNDKFALGCTVYLLQNNQWSGNASWYTNPSTAYCGANITYTYEQMAQPASTTSPIPEPPTSALVGLALAAALLQKRKKLLAPSP